MTLFKRESPRNSTNSAGLLRHHLHQLPPSSKQGGSSQGGGGSNNSGGNSRAAETVALNAFEKKLSINTKDVPELKSSAQWNEWDIQFKVYLKLSGIQELVEPGYVVPDATSHPDAVALQEKKNTTLFSPCSKRTST